MADKTEKKPGFVARAKGRCEGLLAHASPKFFRDTKSELKKVVWPSKAGRQDQHHRRARHRRRSQRS